MKKILLTIVAAILLAIPVAIFASGGGFFLAEEEQYNANIYWTGDSMIIDGDVNGDIFAIGNNIIINGNVNGDIIGGAADSVRVSGVVDGNVRVVAKKIIIDGNVKRAVTVAGENIYFNDKSRVGATAVGFGKYIEARGNISGNLDGVVESLFISGKLTHTNIQTDRLEVTDTAEIRGNLNYESVVEGSVSEDAIIGGVINHTEAELRDFSKYDKPGYFVGRLIKLLSLFVLGLALLSLVKRPTVAVIRKMKADPIRAILWGLIAFIAVPLLAIIFAITIIGLPIAIILVASYIIALYIAHIYTALLIGRWVAARLRWKMSWPWALLLGIFILVVLIALPYIGGMFFFVAVWWGFGGILQVKREYFLGKK